VDVVKINQKRQENKWKKLKTNMTFTTVAIDSVEWFYPYLGIYVLVALIMMAIGLIIHITQNRSNISSEVKE